MRTPKKNNPICKGVFFGENPTVIENIDKKNLFISIFLIRIIIVTCDSSSMISEAALTGKPIYIANILPNRNDRRFQKFLKFI
ncbi:MAG: hypothetical protein Ct9H300mP5_2360 [Candidatus Pelagibacterales bacterium]|nr:MAG: hypothetical protein Ct9H300mP5_2360 [Pelagibacterales bacterium]